MLNSANGLKLLAVFFAIVLLVSGCSDPEKNKVEHYKKGMEHVEKEEWKPAILEFQNAVQIDPKYAEARYQLGLAYLKDGQKKNGYRELVRATDLNPDNMAAQLIIAGMLYQGRNFDKSMERTLKILEIDPQNIVGLQLLANIQFNEGLYPDATEVIDKAISIKPDEAGLYLTKALLKAAQQENKEAEEFFLKAIELAPDTMLFYRSLADFYFIRNLYTKTEMLINRMIEAFPDSPVPFVYLANFNISQGKLAAAEESFKKAIAKKPAEGTAGDLDVILGNFYRKLGRTEEAESAFQSALVKNADRIDIKAALAEFYANQGKIAEAEKEVDAVLTENENHPVGNLVKAKLLRLEGKNTEALAILDNLLTSDPRFGIAYYQRSLVHFNRGEMELSLKDASEAVKYFPRDTMVHTQLAHLYMLKNDCGPAKHEAMIAGRLRPDNFRAARILGQCLLREKEYDQALTLFVDIDEKFPNKLEIMHLKAVAFMAKKEFPETQAICKRILADYPGYVPALQMLVDIALQNRNLAEAVDLVEVQLEKEPENVQYLLILGKLNLLAGKNEQALLVIKKSQELAPSVPYTYTLLAWVYSALGKTDQAIEEFQELIKVNPRLETAHMALAILFESKGDEKKSREHYEKALELNPEFAPAANNLAWMIAKEEGGDLGEAMRLALVAKEEYPEDPYITDTLGWVYYKRQSYGLALTQFLQAANDLPDNLTVQYHLALALKAKGQLNEAREILTAVLASGSDFPEKKAATKLLQQLQ